MEMSDILKKHFADVEARLGTIPDDVKAALARLDEIEQKVARGVGGSGPILGKSAGQLFVENEKFKGFQADGITGGRRISVQTKAIISSLTTDADGSAGDLIVPSR